MSFGEYSGKFSLCDSVTHPHSMHTHTHTRLKALFPGLPRWAGTRKVKPIWILLEQETMSGSGISWAICKSAHSSRQITTPAPHHSLFLQAGCPSCRPTNSVNATFYAIKWIFRNTFNKIWQSLVTVPHCQNGSFTCLQSAWICISEHMHYHSSLHGKHIMKNLICTQCWQKMCIQKKLHVNNVTVH